eukprot:8188673-Alexandrium_andersonii.AAC.1
MCIRDRPEAGQPHGQPASSPQGQAARADRQQPANQRPAPRPPPAVEVERGKRDGWTCARCQTHYHNMQCWWRR